jgi:hypothetical protein
MCLAWPVTKTMAFPCTEANFNLGILIVVPHFLGFGPPSSILCAKKLNAVTTRPLPATTQKLPPPSTELSPLTVL